MKRTAIMVLVALGFVASMVDVAEAGWRHRRRGGCCGYQSHCGYQGHYASDYQSPIQKYVCQSPVQK